VAEATRMIFEPAQCAGDARPNTHEQGPSVDLQQLPRHDPPSHPPVPTPPRPPDGPDPGSRLPAPGPDVLARAERETWLRRRSLERQLHDGAALRISALALQLGLFRHRAPEAERGLHQSIDGLQDELHAALQELRDVARRIYPPLLDVAGLGPALREAAGRIESPVRVEAADDRFGAAAEGAAYFAVAACLETVGACEPPLEVAVRRQRDCLTVAVAGVPAGHLPAVGEKMLVQICHLGGTIDVTGGPNAGTLTARIPCE
jgi:signal transduction histidine kinase